MMNTEAAYNQSNPMNVRNRSLANNQESRWQAVLERDRTSDGAFFFGVVTTGVYCRPSCPARRPLRKNVKFFTSIEAAEAAGLRACLRCKPKDTASGNAALVERLCRYMEANSDQKITLEALSKFAGISPFHLQRVFSAELGISPAKYLQALRFSKFKQSLHKNSVTTAWAEAGYSSPSRVYETARSRLGMAPRSYGNGAAHEELRFTLFPTALGEVLLVAGEAGVCAVQFVAQEDHEAALHAEYPNASFRRDDKGLAEWAKQVSGLVSGEKTSHRIPLDVRGTAFQQKVWRELQKIPAGKTRSYSEVAASIGQQSAVRAVASACARNSLAVLVPCHRVVHRNGNPEGYRWGSERKQKLLKAEDQTGR
jgi:AraC family transcriptional regulator of adaptative response/methylated-DNA-[protein]-cysteine methyltransferase